MVNAWLPESIRVAPGLSLPVLQRVLPCTTSVKCVPVVPGVR